MSHLDRPLFHLIFIVGFGVIVAFVAKGPTFMDGLRLLAFGASCVVTALVVFLFQLPSAVDAIEVVTYISSVRDEYGIGRLTAIGYGLILSGVLIMLRAGWAPNQSLQSGRTERR